MPHFEIRSPLWYIYCWENNNRARSFLLNLTPVEIQMHKLFKIWHRCISLEKQRKNPWPCCQYAKHVEYDLPHPLIAFAIVIWLSLIPPPPPPPFIIVYPWTQELSFPLHSFPRLTPTTGILTGIPVTKVSWRLPGLETLWLPWAPKSSHHCRPDGSLLS